MRVLDVAEKGAAFHAMIALDDGETGRVVIKKSSGIGIASVSPFHPYDTRDRAAADIIIEKIVKPFGTNTLMRAIDDKSVADLLRQYINAEEA